MASTEELQHLVLHLLSQNDTIPTTKGLSTADGQLVDQPALYGALSSLQMKEMVEYEIVEEEIWKLTQEGEEIAREGSHEAKVFNAVPEGGIAIADLPKLVGAEVAKIGQGKAFKNKWIKKDGANITRLVDSIVDQTQIDLRQIQSTGTHTSAPTLTELRKRKLCDKSKVVSYSVRKGPHFSTSIEKQATEITSEMIASGEWKNLSFKKYNFDAVGVPPTSGHLHPLMKVRQDVRQIFFEMGFEEMLTNNFVESSFWNFDALFQPQQHPARDAHDTFFLKDPVSSDRFPKDLMERIKRAHENGGDTGSIGYGYQWKQAEAEKLILRTHTTAVSSYMLYKLAQQKEFRPAKYFSIDRVFRNETVDATHLAEFHQVEGVIADRNLTLGDLIGFMEIFFKKLGMGGLKFKPAYNPYTEPSMEIFAFHPDLQQWVEIGNSGMFRPEMLLPLGLPPDVRVIAWGLGLERPTMVKYKIHNIREASGGLTAGVERGGGGGGGRTVGAAHPPLCRGPGRRARAQPTREPALAEKVSVQRWVVRRIPRSGTVRASPAPKKLARAIYPPPPPPPVYSPYSVLIVYTSPQSFWHFQNTGNGVMSDDRHYQPYAPSSNDSAAGFDPRVAARDRYPAAVATARLQQHQQQHQQPQLPSWDSRGLDMFRADMMSGGSWRSPQQSIAQFSQHSTSFPQQPISGAFSPLSHPQQQQQQQQQQSHSQQSSHQSQSAAPFQPSSLRPADSLYGGAGSGWESQPSVVLPFMSNSAGFDSGFESLGVGGMSQVGMTGLEGMKEGDLLEQQGDTGRSTAGSEYGQSRESTTYGRAMAGYSGLSPSLTQQTQQQQHAQSRQGIWRNSGNIRPSTAIVDIASPQTPAPLPPQQPPPPSPQPFQVEGGLARPGQQSQQQQQQQSQHQQHPHQHQPQQTGYLSHSHNTTTPHQQQYHSQPSPQHHTSPHPPSMQYQHPHPRSYTITASHPFIPTGPSSSPLPPASPLPLPTKIPPSGPSSRSPWRSRRRRRRGDFTARSTTRGPTPPTPSEAPASAAQQAHLPPSSLLPQQVKPEYGGTRPANAFMVFEGRHDVGDTRGQPILGQEWTTVSQPRHDPFRQLQPPTTPKSASRLSDHSPLAPIPGGVDYLGSPTSAKLERPTIKRPMNAYLIFNRDMRPKLLEENPSMSVSELSREISNRWHNLDKKEKEYYLNKARALKEDFQAEHPYFSYRKRKSDGFREGGEEDDGYPMKPPTRRAKKDPEAPKHPMSAFLFYLSAVRPEAAAEYPGSTVGAISKIISERWKVMTAEEKEPWERKSREDKERYARELQEYHAKKRMMRMEEESGEGG
ncbi:uncharacterized protein VTP21DRAFT_3589 [Calcarisporiella thermophila]|uniref:uncharacterized protein n=1 Tax=Calcarisporiella thermophila TaxID=911321 RepID=UPI003742D363